NPSHPHELKAVEAPARRLGLQLHPLPVRRPDEFDNVFAAVVRGRSDVLLVLVDSMFAIHRTRLADLAAKHHLPTMHGVREFVVAGGLMAYGVNLADYGRNAAVYVDKILKGAKPGDLPVEQPTKFELMINLKTAKALGLTIPPSLLARA